MSLRELARAADNPKGLNGLTRLARIAMVISTFSTSAFAQGVPDPCPCGPIDARPFPSDRERPAWTSTSPEEEARAAREQRDYELRRTSAELNNKGNEAFKRNDWDAAIQLYDRAISYWRTASATNNLAKARSNRAFASGLKAAERRDWNSAVNLFDEALRYWNNPGARDYLAWVRFSRDFSTANDAFQNGDWDLAIKLYEEAKKYWIGPALTGNLANARSNKALVEGRRFMGSGDLVHAIESWTKAIALCETFCSTPYLNRLRMYIVYAHGHEKSRLAQNAMREKAYLKAVDAFGAANQNFSEALRLEPGNQSILFWLGETNRMTGQALADDRNGTRGSALALKDLPRNGVTTETKLEFKQVALTAAVDWRQVKKRMEMEAEKSRNQPDTPKLLECLKAMPKFTESPIYMAARQADGRGKIRVQPNANCEKSALDFYRQVQEKLSTTPPDNTTARAYINEQVMRIWSANEKYEETDADGAYLNTCGYLGDWIESSLSDCLNAQ